MTDLIRRKQPGEAWETGLDEVAVTTRDIFNPNSVVLQPNESSHVPWDGPTFGGVVDVSDPNHPFIINEGVYAISAVLHALDAMTVGVPFEGFLIMDAADAAPTVRGDVVATAEITAPRLALTLVYYSPAGGELELGVHNKDSGPITFAADTIIVQQIT